MAVRRKKFKVKLVEGFPVITGIDDPAGQEWEGESWPGTCLLCGNVNARISYCKNTAIRFFCPRCSISFFIHSPEGQKLVRGWQVAWKTPKTAEFLRQLLTKLTPRE